MRHADLPQSLEIVNGLAALLAEEADQGKTIPAVLRHLKSLLRADKVGSVVFSTGGEAKVFCDKGDSCGDCRGETQITDFARRLTAAGAAILAGGELLAALSEEEKRRFRMKYPVFLPVHPGGQALGALWVDGDFSETGAALIQARLRLMYPLICLAFRNLFIHESLLGHEKTLTRILDNLDANIYVSDLENDDILFINKKMSREFGLRTDVTGQKCWRVLQEGMTERCSFCPSPQLARDPGRPIVWEEHNTATSRYYKNTDTVIEWLGGRQVHLQHSVDITAEKAIRRDLEEAKAQAEKTSRAKSDFLSHMSHEIRTPINAIIGMTRLASGSSDPARTHACIRKIDSSSKQLLGLVNDVLDMAKIEANKMELSRAPFDLEKMLMDIANVISSRSEEKRQQLTIRLDPVAPGFFDGDEMRLSQVITNLLSNAVKFTPEFGTVSLTVRVRPAGEGQARLEAQVADTGIGISRDQRDSLFESFVQADSGISRKFGGTGLGLAISRSLVRMMGGDITVASREGHGSVFTFQAVLDRAAPPESARNLPRDADPAGLKILMLDQSAEDRAYFSEIMASLGFRSETAADAGQALAALHRAKQSGEEFHLVVLDWDSGLAQGLSLCDGIKDISDAALVISCPIAQWGDIKKALRKRGAAAYLSKPLFAAAVSAAVREALGVADQPASFRETHRHCFAGRHLLLAEDVEINREIVEQALEDTGVRLSSAPNGQVALNMFRHRPELYDLILMDVNMPEMDGYEATRQIRRLPFDWAQKVPILAMTANAFSEDVEKSLASGMDDHLTKPLNFDTLFSKLRHYFDRRPIREPEGGDESPAAPPAAAGAAPEAAPGPGKQFSAPGHPEVTAGPPDGDTSADKKLVDVEGALERLGGDADFYKTLLARFLQTASFDDLLDRLEKNDLAGAGRAAHTLKGVSGNLSLSDFHGRIAELEAGLKEGILNAELLSACRSSLEKTRAALGRLVRAL